MLPCTTSTRAIGVAHARQDFAYRHCPARGHMSDDLTGNDICRKEYRPDDQTHPSLASHTFGNTGPFLHISRPTYPLSNLGTCRNGYTKQQKPWHNSGIPFVREPRLTSLFRIPKRRQFKL